MNILKKILLKLILKRKNYRQPTETITDTLSNVKYNYYIDKILEGKVEIKYHSIDGYWCVGYYKDEIEKSDKGFNTYNRKQKLNKVN